METDTYTYNDDLTIRTTDKIERYPQKTADGNEIVVVYVDEVEYMNAAGAWSGQGFRWAIVEPHLTEEEIKNWLLNNGLSTVPFLRG
ncbi:TPA: hypothetical protein I7233_20520 [Vibrio vulnificus]|uniref:hypothetical protein n=1 Tax=Vibrio harveyi TaxID=669 RepID=UPI001A1E1487|nr:hypothetical protein [Vibrio harveyi]HAS6318149.1 hypothetical protein [Vibrio vulnificus]HDY7558024.1 hypothetical protein [Vibrio vulnificus]